jgi:kynurenine formamidase
LATRDAAEAVILSKLNLFRTATARTPNASDTSPTREFSFINRSEIRSFPRSRFVAAENALRNRRNLPGRIKREDRLITKKVSAKRFGKRRRKLARRLIVRTLPNDASKKRRAYMEQPPPFFSTEAIKYISEKGVKHLLVDMPSIDRAFDEGKLSNHRFFGTSRLKAAR